LDSDKNEEGKMKNEEGRMKNEEWGDAVFTVGKGFSNDGADGEQGTVVGVDALGKG
jgi:hypothetical protein